VIYGLPRHADVFRWRGMWVVELRIYHVGWTEVRTGEYRSHAEALKRACKAVQEDWS